MNLKKISDASFNRVVNALKNKTFAILTAYRLYDSKGNKLSKQDNIARNRILRGILNENHMGPYQLVGHWQEAPDDMSYDEARTLGLLNDTVERSYLVPKPEPMPTEDFISFIKSCMTIDGLTQDACVIHTDKYYLLYNDGSTEELGTNLSLNKIGQAFSESVLNTGVPFIFDGFSKPNGNFDKQAFNKQGIRYESEKVKQGSGF